MRCISYLGYGFVVALFVVTALPLVEATRHWSNCEGLEDYQVSDGRDYIGHVHTTISGLECQAWDAQSPHHHTVPQDVVRRIGAHNYCRTPFVDGGAVGVDAEIAKEEGPGCFTTDPNVRYERCDVGTRCIPVITDEHGAEELCTVRIFPIAPSVLVKGTSDADVSFRCVDDVSGLESPAEFYYTVDGTLPNAGSAFVAVTDVSSEKQRPVVALSSEGRVTVRVFALLQNKYATNPQTKSYTVVPSNLQAPVVSPPSEGKIYYSAVLVSVATGGDDASASSSPSPTWVEYWKSSTNPDEMPIRIRYDPSSPFWVKKKQEINFQTVDASGRRSDTTTVTFDVRGVEVTADPVFFPSHTQKSVFFGGVRFTIDSQTPTSKIMVRLNGSHTLGIPWVEIPSSPVSALSITQLGQTTIEAKAVGVNTAESDVVVRVINVLAAPPIECSPTPDKTYHHLVHVQCEAVQEENPLAIAAVSVHVTKRSDTTTSDAPTHQRVTANGSSYLTQQGVYEVQATTFTGASFDLGSGDLATTKQFVYTVTSNGLPPPVFTRDGLSWPPSQPEATVTTLASPPIKALAVFRLTVSVPSLPPGIQVRLQGTVNGQPWSNYIVSGSEQVLPGTNATQKVTLVLRNSGIDANGNATTTALSFVVETTTELVSNENRDVLLVTESSAPTEARFDVYPSGNYKSEYVQLPCAADALRAKVTAVEKSIIRNTMIPCGCHLDMLYLTPKMTVRLTGFPTAELAAVASGQLIETLTGVCEVAPHSAVVPSLVDPWAKYVLNSQWEDAAVVGVSFSLELQTAKGYPIVGAGSFKVVNTGVPCDAFTVVRPVNPADGTTDVFTLDDEGDHNICVKGTDADSPYFRLPAVLPVRRAESHLAVTLTPAGGRFTEAEDVVVSLALLSNASCGGSSQVVVKISVDAADWEEGNCQTSVRLSAGTHYVSAMAETTMTNKHGLKVRHLGAQIHATYYVGSTAEGSSSPLSTESLSYWYTVLSDQSALFYVVSGEGQLAESALTTLRVLPTNSSCADPSIQPVGGSVRTRLSSSYGNQTIRRTVAPLLFSSEHNSVDQLVVCLGRSGPLQPYRGGAPISIGQLGLPKACELQAMYNTTSRIGWNQHCYILLGGYGGCSEVMGSQGTPQRLCMCRDGQEPTVDPESPSHRLVCNQFFGVKFGEDIDPYAGQVLYGSQGKAVVYGIALICFAAFIAWLVQQNRDVEAEAAEQDPTTLENLRRASPSKSKGRGASLSVAGGAGRAAHTVVGDGEGSTDSAGSSCRVDPECAALSDATATVVDLEGGITLSASMQLDLEDGSKDHGIIQLLRKTRTGEMFLWQRKGASHFPILEELPNINAADSIAAFRKCVQGMQRRGWDATFATEGLVLTEDLDELGIVRVGPSLSSPPVTSPTARVPPSVMLVSPTTIIAVGEDEAEQKRKEKSEK